MKKLDQDRVMAAMDVLIAGTLELVLSNLEKLRSKHSGLTAHGIGLACDRVKKMTEIEYNKDKA